MGNSPIIDIHMILFKQMTHGPPLAMFGQGTYWTPRAKAIQCLGFEAKDGGPGTYRPGDSLETPWSPGADRPTVSLTVCELENGHRNSGFSHEKW